MPFRAVHLTGLVRDAEGQKMSKTKGNVLDPTELVGEYGADALRFTLASLDSPGRDIPLNPRPDRRLPRLRQQALERHPLRPLAHPGGRAGARVDRPGGAGRSRALDPLAAVAGGGRGRASSFETFRFDEACNRLYHFFWGDFCDWYIELAKPALLRGRAPRPAGGGRAADRARPRPAAAPSGDAVPHRGALAAPARP